MDVYVVFCENRWPGETGFVVGVYAAEPTDLDAVAREHDMEGLEDRLTVERFAVRDPSRA